MPVYLYKIIESGKTFEITQRMAEPALKIHPETGEAVKRLIQPVGISFKGSGFYVNDSRSSSKKKAKKTNEDSKKTKDDVKTKKDSKDKKKTKETKVASKTDKPKKLAKKPKAKK